ncbi:Patellin-2-like [Forsythia ovata]|uniref:Patellin-2-like n=1 Tax=Forsythia ovata TaxID=205694 RepID=A0ABD1QAY9_9LAMI
MAGHPQASQPLALRHHHTRIRPVHSTNPTITSRRRIPTYPRGGEPKKEDEKTAPPPPLVAEEYPPTLEAEKPKNEEEETAPPPPPEEVKIWRIPLLDDEKSDVILLKILRPRDFKVKESFSMLKNLIA